ncbi:unnamed protein product [Symbiodinium natans]|uniref:Uncharacterized protein n=1 Tax=Symbiodinium natans TaxID=878477 RepID=A0A812I9D9_9DINO|nr:unnamed protein product [Symbiodinium natans]
MALETNGMIPGLREPAKRKNLRARELDFHSSACKVPLPEYKPMFDVHLQHLWVNPRIRHTMQNAGFLDDDGKPVDVDAHRRKLFVIEQELAQADMVERYRARDKERKREEMIILAKFRPFVKAVGGVERCFQGDPDCLLKFDVVSKMASDERPAERTKSIRHGRGSRIGHAHGRGLWQHLDKSGVDFRRGGFVTHTSPKLENTVPRRYSTGVVPTAFATDTFRESQDWFRHESAAPRPRTPNATPRNVSPRAQRAERGFWGTRSPRSLSPRSPRRSMSERPRDKPANLFDRADESFWLSPRTPRNLSKGKGEADFSAPRGSFSRGRSEGVPARISARQLSPRLDVSPRGREVRNVSPRDTLGEDRDCRSPSAARAQSPNWNMSEDWMAYSRPRDPSPVAVKVDRAMPSSNFSSAVRRMHSGKITRNSENWLRMNGEDAKPTLSAIANSENFQISRGKRTGLNKDPEIAKHLMRFEAHRVPEPPPTNRKHQFSDNPQVVKHVEELRALSPRRLADAALADTLSPAGKASATVSVQHRTSGEMAAAVQPELSPRTGGAEKYLVGDELVDIENSGLRKSHSTKKAELPSTAMSPDSFGPDRRHANFGRTPVDQVREHIQQSASPRFNFSFCGSSKVGHPELTTGAGETPGALECG